MILLEVKNVTKRFSNDDSFNVGLDNVTLSIFEGEFLAIMGPSGSGKSTLLNLLAGIDTPTFGEITYKGIEISNTTETILSRYRQKTVGIVFQAFNLIDKASIKYNVEYPRILSLSKLNTKGYDSKMILNDLDVTSDITLPAYHLSMGEQQRVAIARALINDPEIILADEPTGSLDSINSELVMELLRKINKEKGKTIILITHNPRLLKYADRVVFMKDSKIDKIELINEEHYNDNLVLKDVSALQAVAKKQILNKNLIQLAIRNFLSNIKQTLVLSISIAIATASLLLLLSSFKIFTSSIQISSINGKVILIGTLGIIGVFFEIMNLLSSSVSLRVRDIGILRALGVHSRDILKSFIIEGLITGILGAVFSIILSFTIIVSLNYIYLTSTSTLGSLSLDLRDTLLICLASILTCLLAAYYPMLAMLKKSIVESLNRTQ